MKNKQLLNFFLLLAAQQLAFLLFFPPLTEPDSFSFMGVAEQVLRTGSFSSETRLPGYPAFLSFFYLLFGQSNLPVIIFQHLLGLLLWFSFVKLLEAGRQRAFFSGLFFCDLLYNSYQHAVLSDFFFSFLICLSAWAARLYSRDGKLSRLLLCGLLVALGVLTKPVLKLFPYFILPAFFLCRQPLKRSLTAAAVFLAVPLLAINLWNFRNYRQTGHYALLPLESYHYIGRFFNHIEFPENSVSKKYLLAARPSVHMITAQMADMAHTAENNMRADGIKTETLDAEFRQIARLSILRHPFIYLKESGTELFGFFFSAHNLYAKYALADKLPFSVAAAMRSRDYGAVILKLAVSMHPFYWLLFALLVWYTARNARRLASERDFFMLYLYGLLAYIALISSLVNEGLARYRCAIQPLILFIASLALAQLFPGRDGAAAGDGKQ